MISCIGKVQNFLGEASAAIITAPSSRRYLSGFDASSGFMVITNERAVLFVDSRYIEAAKKAVHHIEVELFSGLLCIKEFLNRNKITAAYIETEYLSVNEFKNLKNALGIKISNNSALSKILRLSRMIKTYNEIDSIIAAQKITDAAFTHILGYIKAGVSEKDIMLELEFFMRKMGSEGVAFDTIAVAGKNSSLPHGVPTDYKIQNGDLLTMDFGAVVNGYCSDMTRTVAIGNINESKRKVYDTVLKAQRAAIDYIKIGKKCSEIDKIARDIIDNAGYKGCFGHALGHSVGLDIHEFPNFSPRCEEILAENMVITVEPGIYLENEFGVRIEDMIVVKRDGALSLTNSPKELIIL